MKAWQVWIGVADSQDELKLLTQRLVQSEAEAIAQQLRALGRVAQVRPVLIQRLQGSL